MANRSGPCPSLLVLAGVLALPLLAGCPQYGVIDDGSSISYLRSNGGALLNPVELPRRGDGYFIPARWASRGLAYGTDELVSVIVYAGRRVHAEHPGSRFGVADLSPRRGGPSAWHRSHQTGRDVDLLFFARDDAGRPITLDAMPRFDEAGYATHGGKRIRFDVDRTWSLVRALLENPVAEIQYMFIYDPLKQMLLDHARALGEPDHLVAYASWLLHQPGDSLPHDDHIHLRIYCAKTDLDHGCSDRGVLRWTKKDYKYEADRLAGRGAPAPARALMAKMPTMFVLAGAPLPFH